MKRQHYFTIALLMNVFGVLANPSAITSKFNGDWYLFKTELIMGSCAQNYTIDGDYKNLDIRLTESTITYKNDQEYTDIENLRSGTYTLLSLNDSIAVLANGDSLVLEHQTQHLKVFHNDAIFYLKKLDTKENLDSYLVYNSSLLGDQCRDYFIGNRGQKDLFS